MPDPKPESEREAPTLDYRRGPDEPEIVGGWDGTWRDWLRILVTAAVLFGLAILLMLAVTMYFNVE